MSKTGTRTETMAKIDIVSSCLVGTATENRGGRPTTLDLTPWDLRMLSIHPIQKGILLHKPSNLSHPLIDHLKNSLSRILDFFPPLSGRLATTRNADDNTTSYFIDCNDAGAEFTHAVAAALSMSDVVGPTYVPEIVSDLFPLNDSPNYQGISKPLLGVQVTELADGIFIGCTANHAVVDGTSFWHFFNSWSEISRGFEMVSKPPVFERWFPAEKNQIYLPPLDQNMWKKLFPATPLLERVFGFSRDSLAELKAKANYEAGSNNISTLQALLAHLWRGVLRCRSQQSKSDEEEASFDLLIGARARIPLSDGFFGNAAYGDRINIVKKEVLQNGIGFTAEKINELVLRQTREAAVKFVEDWVKAPGPLKMGKYEFVVSSSPRYNVYGCDFGWGKPVAVRSGKSQKVDGKMTVYPAAEAGGIDVEVCLAPETLKALEIDEEFMEAVTA